LSCTILDIFNAIKQVMIQPVIPHRSVVTLNVRVLLRVTWLYKHQLYVMVLGPVSQQIADIFGPIVTTNSVRLPTPFNNLV